MPIWQNLFNSLVSSIAKNILLPNDIKVLGSQEASGIELTDRVSYAGNAAVLHCMQCSERSQQYTRDWKQYYRSRVQKLAHAECTLGVDWEQQAVLCLMCMKSSEMCIVWTSFIGHVRVLSFETLWRQNQKVKLVNQKKPESQIGLPKTTLNYHQSLHH